MGDKPYNCHQCDQSFITNSKLRRHLKTHTVEKCIVNQSKGKIFQCTQCDKLFDKKK